MSIFEAYKWWNKRIRCYENRSVKYSFINLRLPENGYRTIFLIIQGHIWVGLDIYIVNNN